MKQWFSFHATKILIIRSPRVRLYTFPKSELLLFPYISRQCWRQLTQFQKCHEKISQTHAKPSPWVTPTFSLETLLFNCSMSKTLASTHKQEPSHQLSFHFFLPLTNWDNDVKTAILLTSTARNSAKYPKLEHKSPICNCRGMQIHKARLLN